MKTTVKKPGLDIEVEIRGLNEYGVDFSYQIGNEKLSGKDYRDGKFLFYADKTINGKKFGGFSVEGEQRKEIEKYIENLKKEREEEKENLIKKLISGEKLLTVSVVGCDYPQYQAWVEGIDEKIFSAQEIMLEAVKRILVEKNIQVDVFYVVEFLQKIHGENIFCKNEAPSFAINPRAEKDTLDYHDFVEAVITNYEVKLADLMNIYFEKMNPKKAEKEEEEKKEVKIVKKFRSGDEFGAIVECEGKTFWCLNVFDYGLVIFEIDGAAGKKIETTEGAKLKEYLLKNPPIYGGIRM